MRDLAQVIDQLLNVVPAHLMLRNALEAEKASVLFSAPELMDLRWRHTAMVLEEHIPEELQEPWQKQVAAIWQNKPVEDQPKPECKHEYFMDTFNGRLTCNNCEDRKQLAPNQVWEVGSHITTRVIVVKVNIDHWGLLRVDVSGKELSVTLLEPVAMTRLVKYVGNIETDFITSQLNSKAAVR